MKELIKKYEIQSDTLLKVIQHIKSTEEEIERAAVARRFVRCFIDDLKGLKNNLINIEMLREVEMTKEEQIKMYMKSSKEELCEMLIEANRHLKNLPIHVVKN